MFAAVVVGPIRGYRCTDMFSKNERCPWASISSQDQVCWNSAFTQQFYEWSPDKLCQYAPPVFSLLLSRLQMLPYAALISLNYFEGIDVLLT